MSTLHLLLGMFCAVCFAVNAGLLVTGSAGVVTIIATVICGIAAAANLTLAAQS